MRAGLKTVGLEKSIATLKELKPTIQRKVLRTAARAGTKAPRQKLKRSAPRRSGALRKAMTSKVTTSKDKTKVTGTIGANRRFAVITKNNRGRFVSGRSMVAKHARDADAVYGVRPSRYAHLAGKRRTSDYMDKAQQETQSQTLRDFTEKARQEIAKIAEMLRARVQAGIDARRAFGVK